MISPAYAKAALRSATRQMWVSISMHWVSISGGTYNPVTRETTGATETPKTAPLKAVIHYVTAGDVKVHRWGEIDVNDLMVLLESDAEIDGKKGLYFVVEGQSYVIKPGDGEPPESWSAVFGGLRMGRRLALKLKD